MATTRPTLALLSLLAAAVFLLPTRGEATAAVDCSAVMLDMAGCLDYVQVGSKVGVPDAACCGGVEAVVKLDPTCLCEALKEATKMGMALNMTRAAALPGLCKIKSAPSASDCGLAPQPSPSPLPVPPRASPAPSAAPKASHAPSTSPKASPPPSLPPLTPPAPLSPPVAPTPPAPLAPPVAPIPPSKSTPPSELPIANAPATPPSESTSGAAVFKSSALSVLLGAVAVACSLF